MCEAWRRTPWSCSRRLCTTSASPWLFDPLVWGSILGLFELNNLGALACHLLSQGDVPVMVHPT